MSNSQNTAETMAAPAIKIASAWAAWWASVGITSWSDVAAMLAALYTALLIFEWMWKRVFRPFAERRGWIKRLSRRREDFAVD